VENEQISRCPHLKHGLFLSLILFTLITFSNLV
jgi:hypothetical protein